MGVVPEQIMAAPGVKTVGEVPATLGLQIDFSGGVLTKAANPELGRRLPGLSGQPGSAGGVEGRRRGGSDSAVNMRIAEVPDPRARRGRAVCYRRGRGCSTR